MSGVTYKILYVDDQPEMIELVRLTLRRSGYEIYGVTDGMEGLEMMRELHPDLVLLDLMLPGCDGWQVRQTMEADSELRRIPVVLVTARVPNSPLADRLPPPAAGYITKPFSLAEMRSTIQAVLAHSPALAEAA